MVSTKPFMKYFGVVIDSRWSFREHFRILLSKVERMIAILIRIMPNLRGLGEKRKHLYAGVIHFIIMYGVPVWDEAVNYDRKIRN